MKSRLFLLLALLLAVPVFAQVAEVLPEPARPSVWLAYLAVAINTVLVPLAVQLIKPLWGGLPSTVKSILPAIVGGVLVPAATWLSGVLGAPIDLSALMQIFAGVIVGAGASMTYKLGEAP